MQKLLYGFLSAFLVGIVGCPIVGCMSANGGKSVDEATFQQQKERAQQYVDMAQKAGMVAVIQVDAKGKGGFYYETAGGIDLGLGMHATLIAVPGMTAQSKVTDADLEKMRSYFASLPVDERRHALLQLAEVEPGVFKTPAPPSADLSH